MTITNSQMAKLGAEWVRSQLFDDAIQHNNPDGSFAVVRRGVDGWTIHFHLATGSGLNPSYGHFHKSFKKLVEACNGK